MPQPGLITALGDSVDLVTVIWGPSNAKFRVSVEIAVRKLVDILVTPFASRILNIVDREETRLGKSGLDLGGRSNQSQS